MSLRDREPFVHSPGGIVSLLERSLEGPKPFVQHRGESLHPLKPFRHQCEPFFSESGIFYLELHFNESRANHRNLPD